MAYYWDHKVSLDADIERRRDLAERLHRQMGDPPVLEEIRRRRIP